MPKLGSLQGRECSAVGSGVRTLRLSFAQPRVLSVHVLAKLRRAGDFGDKVKS